MPIVFNEENSEEVKSRPVFDENIQSEIVEQVELVPIVFDENTTTKADEDVLVTKYVSGIEDHQIMLETNPQIEIVEQVELVPIVFDEEKPEEVQSRPEF